MKWLGVFLLLSSLSTWVMASEKESMTWSRLGIQFEASNDLYHHQQLKLLSASTDIAETISNIKDEFLPSLVREYFKTKKLIIIFEKKSDTDAMFFPPGTLRESAIEEWIITLNPAVTDSQNYLRIIAHELFHAVHHLYNPEEETWIREGMAQIFENMVFGGFNYAHIHAGLTKSNFPLEAHFDHHQYEAEKYGNTLLYFHYLNSHCGLDSALFWTMLENREPGRNGITEALNRINSPHPVCQNFTTSASGYSLAKLVNNYSGFEQSPHTYILSSDQRLSYNKVIDEQILDAPVLFWSEFAPYRPMKVSLVSAIMLAPTAPSETQWWALEKNYPNRVKQIQPSEMSQLSNSWEVGFFLAK